MTGSTRWLPWREAWQRALYGSDGFYRASVPADHFRTSVHASTLFADAIVGLVRRLGLTSVTDYGAGGGELLSRMHLVAPELGLTAVELRSRPAGLPDSIRWEAELPPEIDGLLIANELLDNVPCDVVELGPSGRPRIVEVDTRSGAERLGGVPAAASRAWIDRWWPLTEPGERAEVGLARDLVWKAACARLQGGVALAVDYGHTRERRPNAGTLTSYRSGRQTPAIPDGQHDLTAHVAMDSLAAAVDGALSRQRDALRRLGIRAERPPLILATTNPDAYVRALSATSEAAELIDPAGLGAHYWLSCGAPTDFPYA